jgi:hypothetical protein
MKSYTSMYRIAIQKDVRIFISHSSITDVVKLVVQLVFFFLY